MKQFIISLLILVLVSCHKTDSTRETHFFVTNDGASMPIYVRGNLDADAVILFLHGGPGGNASQATFVPSFKAIEEAYPIAYWDQRASGLSQGNPDTSTFTVDQFVEDAHYVIQALQTEFPDKKIVLFGHSWGGALGSAYLSTADYQSNIDGFICMNSGHNLFRGLPLSVDWVENYAQEQIDAQDSIAYWTEVRDWCTQNPDMTVPDNYFHYVQYLRSTDAYRHDHQEVIVDQPTSGDIFNSRLSLGILVGGAYLSRNFNILELDLSSQMGNITIPSRVIWGKHDGVNTMEMGQDAYESLGTDSLNKDLFILHNSAHEDYVEEPDNFKNAVIDFVDGL